MDENNTNGFGNTDDEYDDEGTTVLTTPGVNAFANSQGAGQGEDTNGGQPQQADQPEQQNMYGGFGQFQQPGQLEQQNMYSGFGQFQQSGQPGEQQNQYSGFNQFQQSGQPGEQQNQYGGFNQFQQPGQLGQQQNQYGGFNQFQQPGQGEQQNNQYGGFNQFQQPGQPGQGEQQNQYGGFNQFQQPGQQNQYGGFNQFQQPNQYGQPGPQAGVPQSADMKPGMKINKKLIAIIGGIVAAVIIVIIVLAIVLSGGKGQRSASKVGDELAKAYEKGDADAMIDLMIDDYYELYNKAMGLMGSSTYVEDQFNEDVQDMKDEVGTVKSIKIEDREEDKYEQDEIDDVNKTFDMLNVDIKVDECREIDMDVKIKGSESDADGEIVYTVIKSGSKWYLVDYDLYVY